MYFIGRKKVFSERRLPAEASEGATSLLTTVSIFYLSWFRIRKFAAEKLLYVISTKE